MFCASTEKIYSFYQKSPKKQSGIQKKYSLVVMIEVEEGALMEQLCLQEHSKAL